MWIKLQHRLIITVLKPVVRNVYITMISIICLLGNSWLCSNAKIKKTMVFQGLGVEREYTE